MKYVTLILLMAVTLLGYGQEHPQLQPGEKAKNFTLKTIDGKKQSLKELNSSGAVVLVVLRGWPEYQCPICTRQVGQYIAEAGQFKELGASVLMVYPGPSGVLADKADEFTYDFEFPDNFYFVLDPNYTMVNKYGLRWDAPRETAYPTALVIDKNGNIVFSKISNTHGGRAKADEVLGALKKL